MSYVRASGCPGFQDTCCRDVSSWDVGIQNRHRPSRLLRPYRSNDVYGPPNPTDPSIPPIYLSATTHQFSFWKKKKNSVLLESLSPSFKARRQARACLVWRAETRASEEVASNIRTAYNSPLGTLARYVHTYLPYSNNNHAIGNKALSRINQWYSLN